MGSPRTTAGVNPSWRERIDDDVVRISLPFRHGFVNSYLVLGSDGPRLIDTGPAGSLSSVQLTAHLAAFGLRIEDLRAILLTHAHHDHVGMAAQIVRASAAVALIHQMEMTSDHKFASVRPPQSWLLEHGLQSESGAPPREEPEPLPLAQLIKGGEILQFGPLTLELHWTPGHSPGLVCAFDRGRGLLFSTDHLLRATTPLAVRQHVEADVVVQYMRSLDLIRALPARRALPGHGRSYTDVDAAVGDAVRAQVNWLESIAAAIPAGGATALSVAKQMAWVGERGPGEEWLAVARAGAYLRHLELIGRLRSEPGPPVRFLPAAREHRMK